MTAREGLDADPSEIGSGPAPPSVDELLAQYAEIMNESGGPESEDAKVFLAKHTNDARFTSLARTAGVLWTRINKK